MLLPMLQLFSVSKKTTEFQPVANKKTSRTRLASIENQGVY